MYDLFFKGGQVYIDGQFVLANLGVTEDKITYIGNDILPAKKVFDVSGKRIIPGLIDPHVHFALNCGTVESVDDFYFGSKTAAYGGVTTIIDFLDPSRNAEELEQTFNERVEQARDCNIDYHFHACIKEPNGNLVDYVLKMKQLGINTIKLFTTYSETHRRTYDNDIIKLLELSKQYNFIVCAHIEKDELIKHDESLKCTDIAEARPSEAETSEALKLCAYAAATGGNLYMVHCSSGQTLQRIVELYKDSLGKNIFIESCPQYFIFDKRVLDNEDGYKYTFAPPLRSEEEKLLLRENFDYLSTIGTDHCSFNLEDKKSHPMLKGHPLGVGGIETSFVLLHKMFGDKVIDKMSKNVASIERLPNRGEIKVGNYADLVILSEEENIIGKPHGRANYSIYEGLQVNDKVVSTLCRGKFVVENGEFIENKGQLIDCEK